MDCSIRCRLTTQLAINIYSSATNSYFFTKNFLKKFILFIHTIWWIYSNFNRLLRSFKRSIMNFGNMLFSEKLHEDTLDIWIKIFFVQFVFPFSNFMIYIGKISNNGLFLSSSTTHNLNWIRFGKLATFKNLQAVTVSGLKLQEDDEDINNE